MSKTIGKWIADAAIDSQHLASGAKQAVLESKLSAAHVGILNKTLVGASLVVTTDLLAAASTDVAQTDFSAKGIYAGAVVNGADKKKVVLRQTGTDQGVVDANADEVYGVISEAVGVYTMTFFNADGTAHTLASANYDYYFVEIFDMFDMPVDIHLSGGIVGVVDADQGTTLGGHLNGGANKHDASEIDVETVGNYTTASDLETNLGALDTQIGTNVSDIAANTTHRTDTASDVAGKGASQIAVETGSFTATDVQGALEENEAAAAAALAAAGVADGKAVTAQSAIDSHINATVEDKHLATQIGMVSAGDYFAATDSADQAVEKVDNQVKTNTDAITALSGAAQTEGVEIFVLDGTDITNQGLTLANAPASNGAVRLTVKGAPSQHNGDDFSVAGTALSWAGLGLDPDLEAGDKITVIYSY